MNQNGFVNILLIGIVVLVIGIGTYFGFIRKQAIMSLPAILPPPAVTVKNKDMNVTTITDGNGSVPHGNPPQVTLLTMSFQQTGSNTYHPEQPGIVFGINLVGSYRLGCSDKVKVFRREANQWKEYFLPFSIGGPHYLDGEYSAINGMCDVVTCNKIQRAMIFPLIFWNEIGEKPFPGKSGPPLIPDYKTEKLTGDVRVNIPYYTDNLCKNKKIASGVVTVPPQP